MKDSHTNNFLCEDILINILARLPAKSLVRFMCVCKSWSNLIGSSSFITTHLNRNIKNHDHLYLIDCHYYRVGRAFISLLSNDTFEQCLELQHPSWTKERFRVYGSSNGLVCISDQNWSSTSSICIWNPSIRKSISLPKTSCIPDHSCLFSRSYLSFCFHPNHNDYKVVKMLHEWKKRSMEVEVYSLSTNSWKVIEITPWFNSTWNFIGHEVCNGIVYWLIFEDYYRIMSFDTGSEKFDELVVPDPISPVDGDVIIQLYKETICLLQGNKDVDLWVLQEGSFQRPRTIFLLGANNFRLIGLFTDNGLLVEEQSRFTDPKLHLFDLESNQLKSTGILMCDRELHTYIESLVLLDH
ncbi:F-box protein CPR1-like, partial [Rosa sericea]